MYERIGVMTFTTINPEKDYVVKVKDLKEEVGQAELSALMTFIMTNKIFKSAYGELLTKKSCKIEVVNTTNMKW